MMANDPNKNDWFKAGLISPQNTLGDFKLEGLDSDNTQLLSKDAYKEKDYVKQTFVGKDGKFDTDSFNKFYDQQQQTYNTFVKDEYDDNVLNGAYYSDLDYFAPKSAPRRKVHQIKTERIKNPTGETKGFTMDNVSTSTGFTVREMAQNSKVRGENFTPNELGFFGTTFNKDTYVLSQWEEDGRHYDAFEEKEIEHKKGEYRLNDDGEYQYEKLGERSVYGKQVLNPLNVVTKDGSWANKYDFLDSDSKEKGFIGTIMKTASEVAPYVIPKVKNVWIPLTLTKALVTDLLPTLSKSIGGVLFGDAVQNSEYMKSMDKLQGVGARFSGDNRSDAGTESMFNRENILGMAGDVFGQIAQQRYLAKIPMWLGSTRAEAALLKEASKNSENFAKITKTLDTLKKTKKATDRFEVLRTAFANQPGLADTLNKWQRISGSTGKALSMTYMAGVSATGMHEEAKMAGLDDRDAGMLTLGLMAAMGGLMNTDIGKHTLDGLGLDDIALFSKQATRDQAKRIMGKLVNIKNTATVAKEVGEDVSEEVLKKSWYNNLFSAGRNIGKNVVNKVQNGLKSNNPIMRHSLAESAEEVSEEILSDTFKLVHNGLNSLGYTSSKKGKQFEMSLSDSLSRYMMSAVGGAMGGGIMGGTMVLGGKVYETLPENITSELADVVINGLGGDLRKQIEKEYKNGTLPGNPKLTGKEKKLDFRLTNDKGDTIYEPVTENGGMSQNELVYNTLISELDFIESVIYQEGDINNLELKPIYKMRESQLVDINQNSPISDDIATHLKSLLDIEAQIVSIEGGIKDATQAETQINQNKVTALKFKAGETRKELDEILSGRRASEYVGHAVFHLNNTLSDAYGVKDINSYAESMHNKPYSALTDAERDEVDDAYEDYTKLEKRNASKVGYARFKRDMDIVSKMFPDLKKWAEQRRILIEEGAIDSVVLPKSGDASLLPDLNAISSVFVKLANFNADLDLAVQSPFELSQTQTDIPNEIMASENIFEDYINLLSKDKYVNPELIAFLDKSLNNPVPVDYKNENGKSLKDTDSILDDLADASLANDVDFEFPPTFFNGVRDELKSFINTNFKDLTYKNIHEVFEKLENYGFTNDDIDVWMNNRLKFLYDPNDEYSELSITEMDEAGQKRAKEFFLNQYDQIIKGLKDSFYLGAQNLGNGVVSTAQEIEVLEGKKALIDSAIRLAELVKAKEVSPFHSLLNELATADGIVGMENFFDTIGRQYSDSYRSPENFIINSGLDISKINYGINSIARLNALLTASTVWEEQDLHVNKLIGYTNAINNISIKGDQDKIRQPLPEFNTLDFETLYKDLNIVDQRAKLMLNLSNFNVNGTVRESKVMGARALTLYMDSVSQESDNFKLLKNLGLDTTDLEIALNNSDQYMSNIISMNSDPENPIPFNTTDDAFISLKKEADKVEQEIYKLFNIPDESVNDRASRLRELIKSIDLSTLNPSETSTFTQTTKSLPQIQQLVYLFQSATIDPKQFYNDMAGDVQADVNELTNSKLIPFLNQELVIKQLYFYTMSKYKTGIDVYAELMKHILPKTDAKAEDRNPIHGNREDLLSLSNAIFLDGVPGAGKTSTAANFLNKMIARYDLSIATFAPYKEQATNLNSTLEYTDNLLNPENETLDDLFNNLFGIEINDTLKADANPIDKTSATSSVTTNTDTIKTRVDEDPDATGFEVDRLNPENARIAKLLQDFERFTINGKVPNLIVIDEATHINLHNLELLSKLIDIHNAKNEEKISLVLMGDTEQNGATVNMKNSEGQVYNDKSNLIFANMYSTPKLSQAFRSFYSTLNENVTLMRNFRNEVLTKASKDEDVSNTLTLKYKIDSKEGLIGFKTSSYAEEDLKAIFEQANFNDKVAIITDKIDSEAIEAIRALGIDESRYEMIAPNKVQGLERDFVIVDLKPSGTYQVNSSNLLTFDTEMNTIYTSLTRAKKGALINEDASGAIYMQSTSENVEPYKVELNKSNLDAFRKLSEAIIKSSHAELEDLPQNFSLTSDNTTTFTTPSVSDQELADNVLDTASNNIHSTEDVKQDKVASLVNTAGQAIIDSAGLQNVMTEKSKEMDTSTDGVHVSGLSLSYMFHDKLGLVVNPVTNKIDSIDDIENGENNNSDVMLLAKSLGFYKQGGTIDELNNNLEFLRVQLKKLRTGILTYNTTPNAKKSKLSIHLHKTGVDPRVITALMKQMDTWKPKILVKSYNKFDNEKSSKTDAKIKDGGDIAYLVLADPTSPNTHITLSAMPNVNNPNIPVEITKSLNELYTVKSKLFGSDSAYFDYTDNIVTASNLVLRKLDKNATQNYDTFVADNDHLNISEPLILSGDLFTGEEVKELDSFIKGMSLPLTATTDNKHRLRGLPFMLVSTSKDSGYSDTKTLLSRFKSQVKAAVKSDKFLAGDVRLVLLRPKTRTFSQWFDWNSQLGMRFNKGETGLNKDLAASENNYVAAKIIARFTSMLGDYAKAKRATMAGVAINYRAFMPDSIARGTESDQSPAAVNARVDAFMNKIQALMDIAVPAMLKMRYMDYITKLTNYGVGSTIDTDIALSELYKRSDSELKNLQKNFYSDSDEFVGSSKAKEHFITKQMLSFINAKLSGTNVEIIDANEAQVPLNKQEKGALVNMVVALRTAINGGTMKLDDQNSNFQQGIFGANDIEREGFIKQLDSILTSNEQGTYQSLFPGGINSNIVYRRRNDSNKFTGAMPFAMETGVENTELELNVDVQLPKLFVNLAAINLDGVQRGGTSPTQAAPTTTEGESNESVVARLVDKVKKEFRYHYNKRTGNVNSIVSKYETLFDALGPKFKQIRDLELNDQDIIDAISNSDSYTDATADAIIEQKLKEYDDAIMAIMEDLLVTNVAVLKTGRGINEMTPVSEVLIPGKVIMDKNEIVLKWISADKLISRYMLDNGIFDKMKEGSSDYQDLLDKKYSGALKTSNGVDFFYMLENSDKSEIFGKFVLTVKTDDTTGYPSEIDSEFEYLRRDTKTIDLTDFNEFKKHVNNMLTDNKESLNKFDTFVTALEAAVQNDFANVNSEDAVKNLSAAYLSASLAVRQDPAALQALQDLYRDFVNAKKC